MNTVNTDIIEEINAHLSGSMESNASKLVEKDNDLEHEMNAFEALLKQDASNTDALWKSWQELKARVDELRNYSKIAKLRLVGGDDSLKEIVNKVRSAPDELNDKQKAAIELAREMHEYKGFTDILKSLLMWKTSPKEKLDDKR